MIRKFSRLFTCAFKTTNYNKLTITKKLNVHKIATVNLCSSIKYGFSNLPAHQVLTVFIFLILDACPFSNNVRGKNC